MKHIIIVTIKINGFLFPLNGYSLPQRTVMNRLMFLSKLQEIVKDSWHAAVHGVAKSQTGLSD